MNSVAEEEEPAPPEKKEAPASIRVNLFSIINPVKKREEIKKSVIVNEDNEDQSEDPPQNFENERKNHSEMNNDLFYKKPDTEEEDQTLELGEGGLSPTKRRRGRPKGTKKKKVANPRASSSRTRKAPDLDLDLTSCHSPLPFLPVEVKVELVDVDAEADTDYAERIWLENISRPEGKLKRKLNSGPLWKLINEAEADKTDNDEPKPKKAKVKGGRKKKKKGKSKVRPPTVVPNLLSTPTVSILKKKEDEDKIVTMAEKTTEPEKETHLNRSLKPSSPSKGSKKARINHKDESEVKVTRKTPRTPIPIAKYSPSLPSEAIIPSSLSKKENKVRETKARPILRLVPIDSLLQTNEDEEDDDKDWTMPTITSTFSVSGKPVVKSPDVKEDDDDDEVCVVLVKPGRPKALPRPPPPRATIKPMKKIAKNETVARPVPPLHPLPPRATIQPMKKIAEKETVEPVKEADSHPPSFQPEEETSPAEDETTPKGPPSPASSFGDIFGDIGDIDVPTEPQDEELTSGLCDSCGSYFETVEPDEYGETIQNHVCGECLCFLCGGAFPNREVYRGHFDKETKECIPPPTPPPPPRSPTPPPVLKAIVMQEVQMRPNGDEGGTLTEIEKNVQETKPIVENEKPKMPRKQRRRRKNCKKPLSEEEKDTESDEDFKISQPEPKKGRKSKKSTLSNDPLFSPVDEKNSTDGPTQSAEEAELLVDEPPRRSLRQRKPVQKIAFEDENETNSEGDDDNRPEPELLPPVLVAEGEGDESELLTASAASSPPIPILVHPVPASHILSKKDIIWAKKDDSAETTYSAYHKRHIDSASGIHPVSLLRIGGCSYDDAHRQNLPLADAQILHDTSEIEGLSLVLEPKQGIALKVLLEGDNLRVNYFLLRKRATYKYTDEEETPETDEGDEGEEMQS